MPSHDLPPRPVPRPCGRLAVLGLGQLGGSLALAGRAVGLFDEIVGFGRHAESLARAEALGLADRTTTSAADAVAGAATVVLAVPLAAIPAVVDAAAPALAPDALVIDVGSVKGTAARDIEARLPPSVTFVACHPLAGTERFGPEAASAELFRGRRCILCPSGRTTADGLARATSLWAAMGAQVLSMPAALHDHVMAAVSHLPHVAAFALAAALADLPEVIAEPARGLPTTSLRDTSRIAASSPSMWRDIFLENRAALLPLVERLAGELDAMAVAIRAGDGTRLEALLTAARAGRAKLLSG
jgi:prephenate dehydrogenase